MGDDRFVGAWELVRAEARDADGEVVEPVLDGFMGQIVYTVDGRMAATLMRRERPAMVAGQPLSPEQKQQACDDFVAYFGPYRVDEQAQVVIHQAMGAISPAMVGVDQRRDFAFSEGGMELTLSPPQLAGDPQRRYIVWRRVGA